MNRYLRAYLVIKAMQSLSVGWIFSTYVIFLQNHGLSLLQANLLNFSFMMVCFLFATPSGILADKIGQRVTYILGVIGWGGGMFVYAAGRSFQAFLLAEGMAGIGSALMSESLECWLRNCTNDSQLTHQAIGKAGAIGSFVGVLPSVLGSLVAVEWGPAWPWKLGGLCSMMTSLGAFWLTYKLGEGRPVESLGRLVKRSLSLKIDRRITDSLAFWEWGRRLGQVWKGALEEAWSLPVVRLTILVTFYANICFQPFNMFWAPILKQASGQEGWLGLISLGVAVALAAGSYLSTLAWLPTNGRGATLALVSIGLPMVFPASFRQAGPILAFFLIHEVGRGALLPILFTYANRDLKEENRSGINSARAAASTLGRGIGLIVSGFLTLFLSPLVIWRLSAMALIGLSIYFWRRK